MTKQTPLTTLPSVPGATADAGRERRRTTAPTRRPVIGACAPPEPAVPADRHLGNLRLSG